MGGAFNGRTPSTSDGTEKPGIEIGVFGILN
jgi:hypothetical protein